SRPPGFGGGGSGLGGGSGGLGGLLDQPSQLLTEQYEYDFLGNIQTKGGSTYSYTGCARGGGPHAVCRVGNGPAVSYDENGNMTDDGNRTIDYNAANKPIHIDSHPAAGAGIDPGTVDFIYGGDGHRVVQEAAGGGTTARTVYVGL